MSPRTEIDPQRVWTLRRRGFHFRRIGEILAAEANRAIRFSEKSVSKVYYAEEKRRLG